MKHSITIYLKRFFGAWLFLCISILQAQQEQLSLPYSGSQVSIEALPFQLTNTNYDITGYTAFNPKAFVYIKVNDDLPTTYHYRYTLELEITPYIPDGNGGLTLENPLTPLTTTLRVAYNPFSGGTTFTDLDRYHVNNRHGIQVKVVSVLTENLSDDPISNTTVTPDAIQLYLGFTADSEVIPLADTPPQQVGATVVGNSEIQINWNPVVGARNYEVEWTWLDSYDYSFTDDLSPSEVPLTERIFELNSTRVQTTDTNYAIPKIYDRGYFIYRVRAVGAFPEDATINYSGPWSVDAADVTTVSEWGSYEELTAHEEVKNWQFQASYAEEGKKKEVVSYFDGTLRNRQTVTRINSDENAIVGEVIYDNQGRPAIEVLPVPTTSGQLGFYQDFNRNNDGSSVYNHNNFDWEISNDQADCEVVIEGMSDVNGASKYYGVHTPDSDKPFQEFVPDAREYPFSQIEYTPDNTGRIRRKGGVGPEHQLATGHEMRYFYVTPTQDELNRLFGYRVGNASHYKKNMVVDPNGQVSISYIDPQGRTIATALAGGIPSDVLDGLGSDEIEGITTDMLNKVLPADTDTDVDSNARYSSGNYGNIPDGLMVSREIGVVKNNSQYQFDYSISNGDYEIECKGELLTFPFKYDLTLSVTDDCGNETIFNVPDGFDIQNAELAQLVANGNGPLNVGNYSVYKDLRVSKTGLDAQVDEYLTALQDENNACYVAPFELDLPDTCNIDCVECRTGLGDLETYIVDNLNLFFDTEFEVGDLNLDNDGQWTVDFSGSAQEQIQINSYANGYATEWQLTLDACNSECDQQLIANCEIFNTLLLQDLSPAGQYGGLPDASGVFDALSVFNETNSLAPGIDDDDTDNNWRHPIHPYTNNNGTEARIEIVYVETNEDDIDIYEPAITENATILNGETQDGAAFEYVVPQDLANLQDFVDAWQSDWALSLLDYHPEYSYLKFEEAICAITEEVDVVFEEDGLALSQDLDASTYVDYLRQIDTYAHAQDAGLVTDNESIKDIDPFFTNPVPLVSSSNNNKHNVVMNEGLTSNYEDSGQPMIHTAYMAAICDGLTNCTVTISSIGNLSGLTTVQRDAIWQQYRNNYIGLRAKIHYVLLNTYAASQGHYNGCLLGQNPNGSGGVAGRNIDDLINETNVGLYNHGISISGGNQVCDADGALYATKQKRFVPIDLTPEGGVGGNTIGGIVDDAADDIDYITYLETGLCPNAIDLENFLNAFVQEDTFDNSLAITYTGQYLTMDLFQAFGGTEGGDEIEFTGTINTTDAQELNFSLNGSSGSCTNPFSLVLPDTAWDATANGWDDYGTTWQITGFSNIFNEGLIDGTFNFSILAQVQIGSQQFDAVFTGTTCVNLNCQSLLSNDGSGPIFSSFAYDTMAACTIEEDLEADFPTLFNALIDSGNFLSTANYSLAQEFTYQTSILPVYYEDNVFNPTAFWRYENDAYNMYKLMVSDDGTSIQPELIFSMTPATASGVTLLFNAVNNGNLDVITDFTFTNVEDEYSSTAQLTYVQFSGIERTINLNFSTAFDLSCCPRGGGGVDTNTYCDEYPELCSPNFNFDWCAVNGQGTDDMLERNFEDMFQSRMNQALNSNTPANAAYAVSNLNMGSLTEFYITERFGSMCEGCTDYNLNIDAKLVLASGGSFGGPHVAGTTVLYMDGLDINKGAFVFKSGITNIGNIDEVLRFDIEGSNVSVFTYRLNTGEVITIYNKPFTVYAGCVLGPADGTFEDTSNTFCEFLTSDGCDLGGDTGGTGSTGDQQFAGGDIVISGDTNPPSGPGSFPCEKCVPQPVFPVSCTEGYQAYLDFMDFSDGIGTGVDQTSVSQTIIGVEFSSFYQEQFCNLNLQYLVASYSYYIETLNITSDNHPEYLTLIQFGNTGLRYGYNDINNVIDAYAAFSATYNLNNDTAIRWTNYVNTIYLRQHAVCPPRKLYSAYPVTPANDCADFLAGIKATYEAEAYQELLAELEDVFIIGYLDEAINGAVEQLDMTYGDEEYQYTLYYYDQAGNLAQTVPPQGVDRLDIQGSVVMDDIDAYRDSATPIANVAEQPNLLPAHDLKTQYRYNSLNQLVWQQTPDGSITRFAYDDLGRIIASQNPNQDNVYGTLGLQANTPNAFEFLDDGHTVTKLFNGWASSGFYGMDIMEGDGYIEHTIGDDLSQSHTVITGLSYAANDVNDPGVGSAKHLLTVDYGIYTTYSSSLDRLIIQNIRVLGTTTNITGNDRILASGDKLRVTRDNGTMRFYKNDILLHSTVDINPDDAMRLDGAIFRVNSMINDLQFVSYGGAATASTKFSYTTYDGIGRITEAGEIATPIDLYSISETGRLFREGNNDPVNGFLEFHPKNEVTQTFYDSPIDLPTLTASDFTNAAQLFEDFTPETLNLRNRVSAVLYYDAITVDPGETVGHFNHGLFYNYDIHGNVKELVNFYGSLHTEDNENIHLKRVAYDYDLISGNVHRVTYQRDKGDQFIHKYTYDADNRITEVHTSRDGYIWERDASYAYYDHGPLGRMEVGDKNVQGMDYVYTLQGWLKSVNGEYVTDPNKDFGGDGLSGSMVARDAYSYSLGYYTNDYTAVGGGTTDYFALSNTSVNNLYNGNIKQMVTSLRETENQVLPTQVNVYTYDQLNRIKSMTGMAHESSTPTPGAASESYSSSYTYDGNGNLLTLSRKAMQDNIPVMMDDFNYQYKPHTNQLTLVNDAIAASAFTEDLDDQEAAIGLTYDVNNPDTHNYRYDERGQLIEDKTEQLQIEWRVDGKVQQVNKFEDGLDQEATGAVVFAYDGLGMRTAKTVINGTDNVVTTHYARDAQGNVLNVFETVASPEEYENNAYSSISSKEHHLYGSSRLGITENNNVGILGISGTLIGDLALEMGDGRSTSWITGQPLIGTTHGLVNYRIGTDIRLHHALAVNDSIRLVSLAFADEAPNSDRSANTTRQNRADIYLKNLGDDYRVMIDLHAITAGEQTERKCISATVGFTENNILSMPLLIELDTNFKPTINDVQLTLNTDTVLTLGAGLELSEHNSPAPETVDESPLSYLGGNYDAAFQIGGLQYRMTTEEATIAGNFKFDEGAGNPVSNKGIAMQVLTNEPVWMPNSFNTVVFTDTYERLTGDKRYELSNHLGNVLSVVSDKKIPNFTGSSLNYFNADVLAYNDYYPFGMLLPNRHANTSDYRYGFNGKELDNELKGEGNSYDFGARFYDSRVGRFLSIDPRWREFESSSPYNYAHNNPIFFVDSDGENPTPFLLRLIGVSAFRYFYTSRKAALRHINSSEVAQLRRDEVMHFYGVLDGILSTVDIAEMEEVQRDAISKWWKSKPYQTDTFAQKSNHEILYTVLGPEGIALYEQAQQVVSIIENWEELDPYTQGQIHGIIISTVAQSGVGIARWARINLPKLMPKLAKRFNLRFKKPTGVGINTKCFVKGTLILTVNGKVRIENIKIGDSVLSYNEALNKNEFKKVVGLKSSITDHIRVLVIDGNIIETTNEHPFFHNGRWTQAKDLEIGANLVTSEFHKKILEKSYLINKNIEVFNFEVSDNNNYYVSDLEILVHNNCLNPLNKAKLKSLFSRNKISKITKKYDDINSGNASGHTYENDGRKGSVILPKKGKGGNITYKTYDLNKPPTAAQRANGAQRDKSRILVGSDGSVYHTNQHYSNATKISQ